MSEDRDDPYAVSRFGAEEDTEWTDGTFEFSRREVRIPGDAELPEICVKTGQDYDLVSRTQTLRATTPSTSLFMLLPLGLVLASVFLGRRLGIGFFGIPASPLAFLGCFPLFVLIGRLTSYPITVQWYVSRAHLRQKSQLRRWTVGIGVGLLVIIGLAGYYTSRELLVGVPIVIYIGFVTLIASIPPQLRASRDRQGIYHLSGCSTSFIEAWAARSQLGHSIAQSQEEVPHV